MARQRTTCPVCHKDVAVNRFGEIMAHGYRYQPATRPAHQYQRDEWANKGCSGRGRIAKEKKDG